ncbi:MAG: hypothetical protein ACTSYA_06570 [Candidatus Kariarchaeaceae archaeon]
MPICPHCNRNIRPENFDKHRKKHFSDLFSEFNEAMVAEGPAAVQSLAKSHLTQKKKASSGQIEFVDFRQTKINEGVLVAINSYLSNPLFIVLDCTFKFALGVTINKPIIVNGSSLEDFWNDFVDNCNNPEPHTFKDQVGVRIRPKFIAYHEHEVILKAFFGALLNLQADFWESQNNILYSVIRLLSINLENPEKSVWYKKNSEKFQKAIIGELNSSKEKRQNYDKQYINSVVILKELNEKLTPSNWNSIVKHLKNDIELPTVLSHEDLSEEEHWVEKKFTHAKLQKSQDRFQKEIVSIQKKKVPRVGDTAVVVTSISLNIVGRARRLKKAKDEHIEFAIQAAARSLYLDFADGPPYANILRTHIPKTAQKMLTTLMKTCHDLRYRWGIDVKYIIRGLAYCLFSLHSVRMAVNRKHKNYLSALKEAYPKLKFEKNELNRFFPEAATLLV